MDKQLVGSVEGDCLSRKSPSWSKVLALAATVCLAGASSSGYAAVAPGPTPTPSGTTYFEQGNLVRAGETVPALGPTLMGDQVNEYNGSLEFNQTDVSLPGNNALSVMVGRKLATASNQPGLAGGLFGDWEIDIPHLHTIAGGSITYVPSGQPADIWYGLDPATGNYNTVNRCSQLGPPPFLAGSTGGSNTVISPDAWWDGYHLSVPGMGDQTLLKRWSAVSPVLTPTDGNAYPVLTKNHWQLSCLSSLANAAGEGFVAHGPDGTRYQFDHLAIRAYPTYHSISDGTQVNAGRTEIWIMPSQVTDRFGNSVTYTYDSNDPWKLVSIASSDARTITLTYVPGTHRVQTVFDGTRTWTYAYNSDGTLASVTLPDSSAWQFALQPLEHATPLNALDPGCGEGNFDLTVLDPNPHTGTMVHPSGASGSFTHKLVWHGSSNVPGSDSGCGATNKLPLYAVNYSLTAKTLSGPGLPAMTWTYGYSAPVGSFAPSAGNVVTKTVSITDPQGNVTQNTYGTQYGLTEGLLVSSAVGVSGSNALQLTNYSYAAPNAGPYPATIGLYGPMGDAMSRVYTPESQRVINQQGVTFTQSVTGFDIYARPTGAVRSSSLGFNKTDSTTYYDNTNLWVLGQVAATSTNGTQSFSTRFSANTALPRATYSFGKLQATYAFNADGTLSWITDGLNHTTTFSNYVRGLAQNIKYADGSSISGVVNNIGTLNSVTNEAGTAWTFTYDAMGRLSGKIPPSGDPVNYNPTTYSFVQVGSAEKGLEPNHWRQSIAQGNAVTVNYFDARWRKRLTITYDAADPNSTQRVQRFDYDPYNRQTFAAYPARSINSVTTSTPGAATTYDALGRVVQTQADSELGTLTTSTAYLGGFQKQVTNPRGFATTTSYQAFDEPTETAPVAIAAPEGVNVSISRDAFDKPLAITRGGGNVPSGPASVTRSYVYDANQLLCKTVEPEIGATVQSLDAANNVAWRATGLNLTDASSCNTGDVPLTSMVSYSYDARNRPLGTSFADNSPPIGRTYTADGLAATVTSNNSTWTYTYNNRRLPTQESLAFGSTYNIGWSYDANAHVNQLSYPDGTAVAYSPNALGEATQVSGYASGITYQPNGAVAAYALANGTVHSQSQNVRGLPLVNSDSGVLQDQYSYDANGNITAIADQQTGTTSRGMGYDGLDRLTAANAPNVWGNASYGYDGLDNLRISVVGNRSSVHNYDANNRLSSINTNGAFTGYAYDAQGNVSGRGTQGFSFDQGNRMTLSSAASYTYDGLGRRTGISGNDGSYRVQVYSQGGQLLYGTSSPGSTSTRYVYLGGKVIAETDGSGATTYTHTDVLGSPVATVGPMPAAVTYSCPSGWTLSGNSCTQATTTTVNATLAGYTCPSGYTLSGSTCSQATGTTSAATVNYSCPSGGTLSGSTCVASTSSAATPVYGCPSGWSLSGSTCSTTTSTAATPVYSCPSGWSLNGNTCSTTTSSAATPVYGCPSGYTLSGSTCSGTATTAATGSWSCGGQGTLQAYAASPSGYSCLTKSISTKLDPNPSQTCQDDAANVNLVVVHTSVSGTTFQCVIGPVKVYACPSGQTLSGSNCLSKVTQAASVSSYTCSSGTVSGSSCVSTATQAASVSSYQCSSGSLSGSSCVSTATQNASVGSYQCSSGTMSGSSCVVTSTSNASVSYSCSSGQTLSGSTCTSTTTATTAATPYYSCQSGYTLSGTTCSIQGTATSAATAAFGCPNGGTLQGSTCQGVVRRTTYEAYGNTAAGVVPADIGFTGHVNDASTGLVYMQQRYYDPVAGRFLSVDPVTTDANTGRGFNIYEYAQSNPYKYTDPDGRLAGSTGPCMGLCQYGESSGAENRLRSALPPVADGKILAQAIYKTLDALSQPLQQGLNALINAVSGSSDSSSAAPASPGAAPASPGVKSPVINPSDVAGKTPGQIDQLATGAGLKPKGPDPMNGRGSYIDPATGEQRVLIHGDHAHVNDASGNRLDVNGNRVAPESPAAHLPVAAP